MGKSGGRKYSIQRISVCCSLAALNSSSPSPVNFPSWRIPKAWGGSSRVITTSSVVEIPKMRTVARPREPTLIGPGVIISTRFISCIHSGCRCTSDAYSQTRDSGALIRISMCIRGGASDPIRTARRRRSSSRTAPTNPLRSRMRRTAGRSGVIRAHLQPV